MALRVRPAQSGEAVSIARVHDRCWRATYTGMMPESIIARSTYARREAMWARLLAMPDDARCAYVIEDEPVGVVGCAWGGDEESGDPMYTGELSGIYLLPEYRHRGLGRALIGAVADNLLRQGHAALLLWALADNPARRFYEALGGQRVRARETAMDGGTIREIAYGWPDIRLLIGAGQTAAPWGHRESHRQ